MTHGALVGWRRQVSKNGCILSLQVAETADDFKRRQFDRVNVSLNERQMRSLARDLARAAEERGIELRPRRTLWKFW